MSYASTHRPGQAVLGSGMGLYAMADRSVWTGPEVVSENRRFTVDVNGTNSDIGTHRNALISAGAAGTQFWNDWQVFLRDRAAYLARHPDLGASFFPRASGSTILSELRDLVDRYNPLDARFRALTGVASTARSDDTRGAGFHLPFSDTLGTGGSIGLLVGGSLGVVALVALAVLATQARAFAQPALSAMRRNSRRRRRSR